MEMDTSADLTRENESGMISCDYLVSSRKTCLDNRMSDDDDDVDDETAADAFNQGCSNTFYADQISMAEYKKQTTDYTKEAVAKLVTSPEYLIRHTRCQLCWCIWCEGMFSSLDKCVECGGYAMTRPCPICQGQCGSIWNRNVELSHSEYQAHWDGECLLSDSERHSKLSQFLSQHLNDSDVLDGLQDLTT